jgi:hypothetical protein
MAAELGETNIIGLYLTMFAKAEPLIIRLVSHRAITSQRHYTLIPESRSAIPKPGCFILIRHSRLESRENQRSKFSNTKKIRTLEGENAHGKSEEARCMKLGTYIRREKAG